MRKYREEKVPSLRKDASPSDIATSTLSKLERSERPAPPDCQKPLVEIVDLDLKEIHTTFIADNINKDFELWNIDQRYTRSRKTT